MMNYSILLSDCTCYVKSVKQFLTIQILLLPVEN